MITIFGQTLEVHKIILITNFTEITGTNFTKVTGTNFTEVTGTNLRPRKGVSYDFSPRIKEL